jgi:hypothetical protein
VRLFLLLIGFLFLFLLSFVLVCFMLTLTLINGVVQQVKSQPSISFLVDVIPPYNIVVSYSKLYRSQCLFGAFPNDTYIHLTLPSGLPRADRENRRHPHISRIRPNRPQNTHWPHASGRGGAVPRDGSLRDDRDTPCCGG